MELLIGVGFIGVVLTAVGLYQSAVQKMRDAETEGGQFPPIGDTAKEFAEVYVNDLEAKGLVSHPEKLTRAIQRELISRLMEFEAPLKARGMSPAYRANALRGAAEELAFSAGLTLSGMAHTVGAELLARFFQRRAEVLENPIEEGDLSDAEAAFVKEMNARASIKELEAQAAIRKRFSEML